MTLSENLLWFLQNEIAKQIFVIAARITNLHWGDQLLLQTSNASLKD
jgi:hypothetical protein